MQRAGTGTTQQDAEGGRKVRGGGAARYAHALLWAVQHQRPAPSSTPAVTMGLEGELKHEEDEVERKLIHEIVKHLPVVPDQARHALCQ